jgi:cohesin loading factor subunit SCC2
VKTVSQNDNNAQKSMALDHLGIIAGRLRQCVQKYGRTAEKSNAIGLNLKTVEEVRDVV